MVALFGGKELMKNGNMRERAHLGQLGRGRCSEKGVRDLVEDR